MKRLLAALLLALATSLASAADTGTFFATSLPDLHNAPLAMSSLKGKPLVVNFWAQWCRPCRQEMPEFVALAKRAGNKLNIIGVALEDYADDALEFAQSRGINYPLVFAGAADGIDLMRSLGNAQGGIPFTVIIDAQGEIIYAKLGLMTAEALENATRDLY